MTVLVQHTFTGVDSTTTIPSADTGQATEVLSGTWGINANRAYKVSTGTAFVVWNSGQSDVQISVDKYYGAGTGYKDGGIVFRATNASNFFIFRWNSDNKTLRLYRFQNGSATLLVNNAFDLTVGAWHSLKVAANGTTIECYVDGILRISVTDSFNQTATKHGLRQFESTGEEYYDNFLVESLTTGTTPTVHEGESVLSSASNLTVESALVLNGESTLSAVSNLTAEATVIQSAEAILSAISNLTAEGDKISQEVSVDLSATSSLSAIGNIVVNGETVLSANSELTAIGEIISMDISVDLSARTSLTVEGSVIQSSEASFSAVSQLEAIANLILSGEVELSATSQLTVLPEKDLVGVIRLKGKRELYVYLKGKRELEVHLKGGLNVTEYNQNFSMESGDSKTLLYAMDDDLTGATLKWEMYQRGQTTPLINKTGAFANSSVQIELVPADTQGVYGTYRYELHCELLGNTSTLAKGVITLE